MKLDYMEYEEALNERLIDQFSCWIETQATTQEKEYLFQRRCGDVHELRRKHSAE